MHGHALDHRWWIPAFVNVDHLDDPVRPAWGLAHGQLWTLFALASLSCLRIIELITIYQAEKLGFGATRSLHAELFHSIQSHIIQRIMHGSHTTLCKVRSHQGTTFCRIGQRLKRTNSKLVSALWCQKRKNCAPQGVNKTARNAQWGSKSVRESALPRALCSTLSHTTLCIVRSHTGSFEMTGLTA